MSGHADTIRRFIACVLPAQESYTPTKREATAALDALLVEQADRIAWLEGEVAGWRIKLAECEERQR